MQLKQQSHTATATLPCPEDQIIITYHGAKPDCGIGVWKYLLRDGEIKLGALSSVKLNHHHARWWPCEIEALSIATSVTHFSPCLRHS